MELDSVLDEDARRLIDNIADYLLEPGGSRGPANSYMDTALRGDRRAFLDFLRLLHQRGCLRLVGRRRGRVTPFFVKKKGDKQRLVFDCRRVNTCFREPPYTEIGSAKAFSSISVDPGETVFSATTDIEACFYQCGVTPELSEWFSLAGLTPEEAELIGMTIPVELAGGPLFAALRVLPMGWSWAFWLVQRSHLHIVRKAGVDDSRIAFGGWPFPDLRGGPVEVPYCDNVTVVGTSRGAVLDMRDQILNEFSKAGFKMHETSEVLPDAVILGGDLGGKVPRSRRTASKLWRLRAALEHAEKAVQISGREVEVLFGHWTAACLYCPPGLSVPRALYTFVHDCYFERTRLWASARYELWVMKGIIFLLESDLSRPWAPGAVATDACETGFGVCRRALPAEIVKDIGAWSERWRFRRLGPEEWQPRARALGELSEITDPRTAVDDDDQFRRDWRWREGFPEIPASVCDEKEWTTSVSTPARFVEDISVLEGRGFLLGLRGDARDASKHGSRRLYLVDNFGLACAVEKGRAKKYCILQICRRPAALCLATAIHVAIR